MSDRKQLQAQLKKLRAKEKAARGAYHQAVRNFNQQFKRVGALYARLKHAEGSVQAVRAQLKHTPAVAQAVLQAPAPFHEGKAEPMSVEKIARHLRYGSSGRTRGEIAKTLESAVSKVRAVLLKEDE